MSSGLRLRASNVRGSMSIPSDEADGGRAAQRVDQRRSGVPQAVAAAGLEHDVARLVLFGDPERALEGAQRAAGAVEDLEGLVGAESHGPGSELDLHGLPPSLWLAFGMRSMHAVRRALKR